MVPVLLVWWLVSRDTYAAPWAGHVDLEGGGVLLPLLCVLALGVVGTGLAYMLQFDVVRGAGATVSTTVTYLIPVVSVLLGVLVLDEHLAWPQLLGAGDRAGLRRRHRPARAAPREVTRDALTAHQRRDAARGPRQASAGLCTSRRRILPVGPLGSSSTCQMWRGYL